MSDASDMASNPMIDADEQFQKREAMRFDGRLIWIDLEMTGLDTDHDSVIEIATIVTDANLNVLAEGPQFAITQPRPASGTRARPKNAFRPSARTHHAPCSVSRRTSAA